MDVIFRVMYQASKFVGGGYLFITGKMVKSYQVDEYVTGDLQ